MKTEIFIALILGTIIGLGGMLVIAKLTAQGSTPTLPAPFESPKPDTTNSDTPQKTEVISPSKSTSWDLTALPVKGISQKGNFIFLVNDITDTVIPLSDTAFDTTTSPVTGIGGYRVYTQFGEKLSEALVVSFKDLAQNKTLIFGSVTDLTAESLQMRAADGTIDQVAYSPNIVVGSFIKDIKKINTGDVAIGDKIVVVSDPHEKGIVVAQGIFVLPADFSGKTILLKTGTLNEINKTELTYTTTDGEQKIKTDSTTKLFGIKENGTVRKRTKLIPTDKTRTIFVTYVSDSPVARSLFISE